MEKLQRKKIARVALLGGALLVGGLAPGVSTTQQAQAQKPTVSSATAAAGYVLIICPNGVDYGCKSSSPSNCGLPAPC